MAQGEEHEVSEDLDIWLIKIMCEHVGVLKQSSFMHSLFAHQFYLFIYFNCQQASVNSEATFWN